MRKAQNGKCVVYVLPGTKNRRACASQINTEKGIFSVSVKEDYSLSDVEWKNV